MIQGTTNHHVAFDDNSFTKELHKVFREEDNEIAILEIEKYVIVKHVIRYLICKIIPRKVNHNWKNTQGYKQFCKSDCLQIGNNWSDYMWPTGKKENISGEHCGKRAIVKSFLRVTRECDNC